MLSNYDPQERHVTPRQVLPEGLIDEWLSYPVHESGTNVFDKLSLLRRLQHCRYDVLVYLAPRVRTVAAARRDLLFFRLAGIRSVVGADGLEALTRGHPNEPLPTVTHEADHLLSRLGLSGIKVPEPGAANFNLTLTEHEISSANEWIESNVEVAASFKLIGVGPGSKWASKVWPEENFVEVGRHLFCDEAAYFPIIFGGPADRALGERLLIAWGRGANAAGILSPREAAAALSRCALYLGNDTGTMHLSAAVGTPCTAIMSAQDWPGRWHPYGNQHIVLRKQVSCEGCQQKVCDREALRCLTETSVAEVVKACSNILSRQLGSKACGARQSA